MFSGLDITILSSNMIIKKLFLRSTQLFSLRKLYILMRVFMQLSSDHMIAVLWSFSTWQARHEVLKSGGARCIVVTLRANFKANLGLSPKKTGGATPPGTPSSAGPAWVHYDSLNSVAVLNLGWFEFIFHY